MGLITRRQTLRGIGALGIGALAAGCSSSDGVDAATPTAPPRTSTPLPSFSPTRTAAAPTSTAGGATVTATQTPRATTPSTPTSAAPTSTPTQPAIATDTPAPSPTAAAPTATSTGEVAPTEALTPTATETVGAPSCILSPEQTQGPYFLDLDLLRRDIREDRNGLQMRLVIQLVDVDTGCSAIRDALIDVWHADASGVYSGFAGQLGGVDTRGKTFLRGTQVTDAAGKVEFTSIYPGWYPGRALHVHLKAYLDSATLLTSQLYFPEDATALVYSQAPYSFRGLPDTSNEEDGLIGSGGVESLSDVIVAVAEESGGYVASIVIGVSR